MLLKSLGTTAETPGLSLRDAQAGDRYLLCSDGLSAVVPGRADINLIELANAAGARTTSPASWRT